VYNEQGDTWWDENQFLHLLKSSVNPARVGYFRRLLDEVLKFNYRGMQALDVGCGGGILAEEFASIGFRVTGIDPSERSLATAKQHAQFMGLSHSIPAGNRRIHPVCRQHFPRCVLLRRFGARPRLAKSDRRNLSSDEAGRHIPYRHAESHLHQ
jgi:SAM-dependent methyltransferase